MMENAETKQFEAAKYLVEEINSIRELENFHLIENESHHLNI